MPAGAWQRGDWKPTQRRQRGVGRASWDEDRKLEGDALGRRCRGDALQREWCLARRFAHRLCKHRQNCQDKRRAATPSTALLAHLAAVAPTVLPSSGCHNVSVSVTSAPVRLKSPRQPDSSWSNWSIEFGELVPGVVKLESSSTAGYKRRRRASPPTSSETGGCEARHITCYSSFLYSRSHDLQRPGLKLERARLLTLLA